MVMEATAAPMEEAATAVASAAVKGVVATAAGALVAAVTVAAMGVVVRVVVVMGVEQAGERVEGLVAVMEESSAAVAQVGERVALVAWKEHSKEEEEMVAATVVVRAGVTAIAL